LLVLQPRPGQSQTGLGCSRFARHYYGNLMLISLRRATEMFQFTRCPPPCLCVQQAVSRHYSGGVAPFGISGLLACMQLPLNVSPVSASFIGLQRLGIHLVLYVACSRVCASASLLLFGKIEERKVFSYSCTNCLYGMYELVVGKQATDRRGRLIGQSRPFPSKPEQPINRPLRSVACLQTLHTPVYKKVLDNWRVENSDKRMSLEAGLYRPGSE
jgi:hypothetical protein